MKESINSLNAAIDSKNSLIESIQTELQSYKSNEEKVIVLSKEEKVLQERLKLLNAAVSDKDKLVSSIMKSVRAEAFNSIEDEVSCKKDELDKLLNLITLKQQEMESLKVELDSSEKTLASNAIKTQKLQIAYKSLKNAIKEQNNLHCPPINNKLILETDELLTATVGLKFNYLNVKQLRVLFNQNKKTITDVFEKYKSRYTTKANMSIYQLMVVALEAELQNVLYNIKFGKIDDAINDIKNIAVKYLKITSDGNQSIAPTVTKFIGEIEYL